MKQYSKDDLIRKKTTRIVVWGLGVLAIIVGSKHLAYNGLNWTGAFVGLSGIVLLIMLNNAYENLLNESDALQKEGDE